MAESEDFAQVLYDTPIERLREILQRCEETNTRQSDVDLSRFDYQLSHREVCHEVGFEMDRRAQDDPRDEDLGFKNLNDFLEALEGTSIERLVEIMNHCVGSRFTDSDTRNDDYNLSDRDVCIAVGLKLIRNAAARQ